MRPNAAVLGGPPNAWYELMRRGAYGLLMSINWTSPRLKMIADEHGIETELLGENGKIEKFLRPELFRRGLVSEPHGHAGWNLSRQRGAPPAVVRRRASQAPQTYAAVAVSEEEAPSRDSSSGIGAKRLCTV